MRRSLPKIIGITGKKFHGKDTLADILIKKYGYRKLSFAAPLKEACRVIFGLTDSQLYGIEKETVDDFWKTTPRHILQFVGTDLFRQQIGQIVPHVGANIWVESVIQAIRKNPNGKYVISDVRFPNEVEALRQFESSAIWKVIRNVPPADDNLTDHASENQIDSLSVDLVIENYGTIDDLKSKVEILNLPIRKQDSPPLYF